MFSFVFKNKICVVSMFNTKTPDQGISFERLFGWRTGPLKESLVEYFKNKIIWAVPERDET